MGNFKVWHTADWHISRNAEKREESQRCICAILDRCYQGDIPNLFVLAGDTVDCLDGHIDIHSEAAEVVLDLVQKFAEFAPVAVVRGTLSHDRNAPAIFRRLRTRCPVHVATSVEQVRLVIDELTGARRFLALGERGNSMEVAQALLTFVPSLDKSYLAANYAESVSAGNIQYRQLMHDLLAGLGLVNASIVESVPKIFIGHGMLTGSVFSTGQTAIGEDMEFSLNDLAQAKCDAVMLGHVHKFQKFGNVAYSGSPGRLNFGEVEDKGFLEWTFSASGPSCVFMPLPARRFVFGECMEWSGANNVYNEAVCMAKDCAGAYVRLRFVVPEEERHSVNRDELDALFKTGGALSVKIEAQTVPKVRQRAAGISRLSTLPEKVQRWSASVGEPVPDEVISLAGVIETRTVEELVHRCLVESSFERMVTSPGITVGIHSTLGNAGDLFSEVA